MSKRWFHKRPSTNNDLLRTGLKVPLNGSPISSGEAIIEAASPTWALGPRLLSPDCLSYLYLRLMRGRFLGLIAMDSHSAMTLPNFCRDIVLGAWVRMVASWFHSPWQLVSMLAFAGSSIAQFPILMCDLELPCIRTR